MDFVNLLIIRNAYTIIPQQINALLQSTGNSFCPDHSDWLGIEAGDAHSRNADRSVLSKFLQCHPADFSTTKLQVRMYSILNGFREC